MKYLVTVFVLLMAVTALAHEGGHGTPEDPIANLPKINSAKGEPLGVEAMVMGSKAAVMLRNSANQVVTPDSAGLPKTAKGAIKFQGGAKWTEFPMTASAKGAYEGTFKGNGSSPQLKLTLEGGKGGKKQSVIVEQVEQSAPDAHSHGSGNQPHSHGSGQTHTH
jgi:hypothetical protein